MKASAYFNVDNEVTNHAVKELKQSLGAIPGVLSVSVSSQTGAVAVDYDTTAPSVERIGQTLRELGYDVSSISLDKHIM